MKAKRIATMALLVALVGAAVVFAPPRKEQVSYPLTAVVAEQIRGNTPMLPATTEYFTVLVVPDNYQSDPRSAELLQGFAANSSLKILATETKVTKYTASHPDFAHRWASVLPEARTQPVVLIGEAAGDKWTALYKQTAPSTNQVASAAEALRRNGRLRPRPCPNPSPTPPVTPTPTPTVPTVPETPAVPETPVVPEDESNPLLVALAALGGGLVTWAAFFNRRM